MYVCLSVAAGIPCLFVCFSFATPKDSWPKMDRTGLTMELAESKDG